jgi:hypothetical protein
VALSSGELAQIVWAETKDLPPGKADGTGDVNGIRRLVAQLAASLDGNGFDKRASLPPVSERGYGDTARAIMAIAETAKDAAQPQSRLIFWEAGDNTIRPNAAAGAPPPPWSTMTADGITYQGRFQLAGGRIVDIFSRAPLDGDADAAPFVNAITGTGMPEGKPLLLARSGWVGGKPKTAVKLFIVALALFLVTALWAYGVGLGSRLTIGKFNETATVKPLPERNKTSCNPSPPTGLDFALGPEDWRLQPDGSNKCYKLYTEAQQKIADDKTAAGQKTWVELFANYSLRASGSSGASVSLVLPLAFGFVAFALLFIASGYGVSGRPMGAIIDERYRMSLTLTQAVLWAVVILGAWLVLGLYNIGFGGVEYSAAAQAAAAAPGDSVLAKLVQDFLVFPTIPKELWAVLGLAAATPYLSRLISQTNIVVSGQTTAPPGGRAAGYLERNGHPSEAHLGDMVLKETEGTSYLVDATRVQHAAITGILVVSYAMLLFGAVSTIEPTRVALAYATTKSVFTNMPAVDATFLALLFTSHAALVLGKAYDKRAADPSATGSSANR